MRIPVSLLLGIALIGLVSPAQAQFNNEWVAYQDESSQRLGLAPGEITNANNEGALAWGDLNNDGFNDLVVARKQPQSTAGKRPNLLLMNESGILRDRTALYASASDVAGDQGFLTPTNDRDIIMVDVDRDGWLDVVTATTYGGGDPKHISHPRVYHNQGDTGSGWAGLRYEAARMPQFPLTPDFCQVSAGDITNDTYPDLFFADYGSLDDRLVINDGNGFFTDESTLRMTTQMLSSGFGTSSAIGDFNLDGNADVMKSFAGNVSIVHANKNQAGFFNLLTSPYGGSAYFASAGDLNNDGRLDLVVSDDSQDRHIYNTGVNPLGAVTWGPAKTFQFLAGGDDGFGGNSIIADLDNDGFNDAVVTDVDVDVGGCTRRTKVYHNPGGLVGSQPTLLEERQQASGGWLGAVGLVQNDLIGGHDAAAFDINNDGSTDLVFARCSGTFVFMNEAVCQQDLGFKGPGTAHLSLCGGDLSTGTTATLKLTSAAANRPAFLVLGVNEAPTFLPQIGGTLVPVPVITMVVLATDAKGSFTIPGIPGGQGPIDVIAQVLVDDPSQTKGFQVSNALRVHLNP